MSYAPLLHFDLPFLLLTLSPLPVSLSLFRLVRRKRQELYRSMFLFLSSSPTINNYTLTVHPFKQRTDMVWMTYRNSPGKGRGKLRQSPKYRGTVHLPPQPSRSRPATETENRKILKNGLLPLPLQMVMKNVRC